MVCSYKMVAWNPWGEFQRGCRMWYLGTLSFQTHVNCQFAGKVCVCCKPMSKLWFYTWFLNELGGNCVLVCICWVRFGFDLTMHWNLLLCQHICWSSRQRISGKTRKNKLSKSRLLQSFTICSCYGFQLQNTCTSVSGVRSKWPQRSYDLPGVGRWRCRCRPGWGVGLQDVH